MTKYYNTNKLLSNIEMLLLYGDKHPLYQQNSLILWTILNIIFVNLDEEIDSFMKNHTITLDEYLALIKHTYTAFGLEDIEREILSDIEKENTKNPKKESKLKLSHYFDEIDRKSVV